MEKETEIKIKTIKENSNSVEKFEESVAHASSAGKPEKERKFLAPGHFACSLNRLLNKAIMNTSKEKTPKITQLLKKLADIIAKKDISKIMKRKIFIIFPSLAVSRKAKESRPTSPKNMEKSFQLPIKLEVT